MAAPRGLRRVPHVYVLIISLLFITAIASLFIAPGAYERDDKGRVVPGSFMLDDAPDAERGERAAPPERPRGWSLVMATLTAPLRGIEDAGAIVAFILVVGGAFKIMERTGAFQAAIRRTMIAMRGNEAWLIPGSMLIFSVGGAVFGMSEEVIPFVILFVPLARALGYSNLIGVAIPLVGAALGFAGAMINPFTVGVAQAIAGLPPLSGWPFRTTIWVLLTAFGIGLVLREGRRHRITPEEPQGGGEAGAEGHMSLGQVLVLVALGLGIVVIIWGVGVHEWYVSEIGAIFFAVGIASGLICRVAPSEMSRAFLEGGRELLSAGLVVGLAKGIVLVAHETRILDPILHGMAQTLSNLPGVVSLNLMFVFQSVLNFLVPSGSGQAALTMPIMAPLAELSGLTRQMSVLAFQFGDGFSNLIVPTSAVLMGSLEAGKVPYEKWLGFAWRLQLWLFLFGVVALTTAVLIGYS